MPRQGRIQSGTGVYHVMIRGINRQQIFESVPSSLLHLSQCQTVAEFQRKDITERKQICRQLKARANESRASNIFESYAECSRGCRQLKELGVGVRQLSRLTGISLGTISKCRR